MGATVVPVIVASDKTHLTNHMGSKEAWPVYLTTSNIPKDVRKRVCSHSSILIGFPVTRLSIFKDSNRGDEVNIDEGLPELRELTVAESLDIYFVY